MKNGNLMLQALIWIFIFSSCSKKDVTPANLKVTSTISTASNMAKASLLPLPQPSNQHLVFEESVEEQNPFSTPRLLEVPSLGFALNYVSDPVFMGTRSARFEVDKGELPLNGLVRSQIGCVDGSVGDITKEAWYSFACYFPSTCWAYDTEKETVCEWGQSDDACTALCTEKDQLLVQCNPGTNRSTINIGSIPKDTWCQFVFHFIHSPNSDGLIECWLNGTKVCTLNGANLCSDVLPLWKIGICKAFQDPTSGIVSRAVYFDNIRCGKDDATYDDMCPCTPPPPPTNR